MGSSPYTMAGLGATGEDISIMPYMADGSVHGSEFQSGGLDVMHLFHKQRPAAFYLFRKTMAMYAVAKHAAEASFPATLQDLEAMYSMRIVLTISPKDDQDDTGCFDYYRVAIYVSAGAENLKNICMLIDSRLPRVASRFHGRGKRGATPATSRAHLQ